MRALAFLLALSAMPALADSPGDAGRGKRLFARFCVSCHGADGAGDGPSAGWLDPHPRDFTRGVYACRSTPTGSLPTDEDLLATVGRGITHSQMPGWVALSDRAKHDLVAYIKSFSPRFTTEKPEARVTIPPEVPSTPERIAAGKALWEKMQCFSCHGPGGRGDGQASGGTADDWGWHVRPANLTEPNLRCGEGPGTIVRDLLTGLSGTAMPSYADSLTPDELWSLAHFVWSLSHPDAVAQGPSTPGAPPKP